MVYLTEATGVLIFSVCVVFSFIFGLMLIKFPLEVFAVQKRFYAFFNWRIEPISLSKEIRNTKIMGGVLVAITIIAVIAFKII